MIVVPVAPVLQVTISVQLDAVNVIDSLTHTVLLVAVMVGICGVTTLTVTSFDLPLVQVPTIHEAAYVVVAETVTVIEAPSIVFDHFTVPAQPVAERLILQSVVLETEILGADGVVHELGAVVA